MDLYERLEQIILELRPAFSREASFRWFVLLLWGTLLTTQPPAVTSYVNALGLSQAYYCQSLHWFHSTSFSINVLCSYWSHWLGQHPQTHRLRQQLVYIGDGIKVGKEGRKMPGVKGLHQESDDVNKPEWIRGHYFSALGVLLSSGQAFFLTPVIVKLHDGIEPIDSESDVSLVDKMAALCVQFAAKGSYIVLDAYYSAANVLAPFREHGLHLISRIRISATAHAAFSSRPGKRGRGRPRQWGEKVKLQELFLPIEDCIKSQVWLYGKRETVYHQSFQFHWDSPEHLILFVLAQLSNGKRIILLSTDLTLSGEEVITAYGWRFKIELTFRTMVHLLGSFCYRFWLKSLPESSRWPKNLRLAEHSQELQAQVILKVEAFERFVNLNAIAIGLLQILALEMPHAVWKKFPIWFRTLPSHGYPSEQIVRLSIQNQWATILSKSKPTLLLTKLLSDKSKHLQDLMLHTFHDVS
jgi:hypothetical protein